MVTIVASSTTISWASPTVPRISHRRRSGVTLARAAGRPGTQPAADARAGYAHRSHLTGAVRRCGAGTTSATAWSPRASELVAGHSTSRDVPVATSLRARATG